MYTLRTRFLCQSETASKQQEGQVEKTVLVPLPWNTLVSPLIPAKWRMLSETAHHHSHKLGKETSKRFRYQQINLQSKYWLISKVIQNQNINWVYFEIILLQIKLPTQENMNSHWDPQFSLSPSSGSLLAPSELALGSDVSPSRPAY